MYDDCVPDVEYNTTMFDWEDDVDEEYYEKMDLSCSEALKVYDARETMTKEE